MGIRILRYSLVPYIEYGGLTISFSLYVARLKVSGMFRIDNGEKGRLPLSKISRPKEI